MVASDGGIFSFGDTKFYGSMIGLTGGRHGTDNARWQGWSIEGRILLAQPKSDESPDLLSAV